MKTFDENGVGVFGNLFGLPYDFDEAEIVIVPVPWDVSASYQAGTSNTPSLLIKESTQLDYCISGIEKPWLVRTVVDKIDQSIEKRNKLIRPIAERVISALESGAIPSKDDVSQVNLASIETAMTVKNKVSNYLDEGKICGVLGGDHSSPEGLIEALSDRQDFGILHLDAHMDLRDSYEGFEHSHASIMHNALKMKGVKSLVQVGVRDYCPEEQEVSERDSRVTSFFDDNLKAQLFNGAHWSVLAKGIVDILPQDVYVSLDVDGLSPDLCPTTGTPVPGGLSFSEADFLIREIVKSGRKIIGFDLSEVGTGKLDLIVGMRLLYRLSIYTAVSQGITEFK